jgi:Tfp pilus assembly protein PilO
MIVAAARSDAVIAIALAALVAVIVWQVFGSGRTDSSTKREKAYRQFAEEAAEQQRRIGETLEKATAELSELRQEIRELDRVLRTVE